ncbi:MAG: hypothetical protein KDC66_03245 [Phaeodactylibacter sp.]|nr:hypothetical protein [Phaeodactylibacter sp.]MCB9273467.1 hypothetical protein [Lewinellaceae bacterium]
MNNRKIKLALTVALLNAGQNNILEAVKGLMLGFKEVGAFLGQALVNNEKLNPAIVKETYAIQFENCTLEVGLVSNPFTRSQSVQGFELR